MKDLRKMLILGVAVLMIACTPKTQQEEQKDYVVITTVQHPEWTKDAVIYEVNLRQHTEEGTFNAFAEHLPRLQKMGVDILWLMPIFPIGEVNRKISQTALIEEVEDPSEKEKYLGSYYSTSDYYAVNPKYGTMDDFKALVKQAHDLGMYVILDIAANHTAWDSPWVTENPDFYTRVHPDSTPWSADWMAEHPEYYERIRKLGMTYPIDPNETDWWDVADLNYDNEALRAEMLNVFKFWIKEANIDGYRCDVAGWVPCDFWEEVRTSIDSLKSVFMLAEDEAGQCLMKNAFDMNYAWEQHFLLHDVIHGEKTVAELADYFVRHDSIWDPSIYRMNFITNHDENTWKGTISERYGEAAKLAAVLSFTIPGMPLLYSGQETGLNKRLKFFEKDPIEWTDSKWQDFYTQLIGLKTENDVFWNGIAGGSMDVIQLPDALNVFAFERKTEENRALVLTNLSDEEVEVNIGEEFKGSDFVDGLSGQAFDHTGKIQMKAWGFLVLLEK